MSTPVIHLEEYFLQKVLIERLFSEELDSAETFTFTFDHEYAIRRNKSKPNEFALTFTVRDNPAAKTPSPQAYKLDLQIVGVFSFDEGVEEQQMQYLIRYNGCAILYGILRGMLATMTGTFPEGSIRMPTVMIDEIVKKVENQNQTKALTKNKSVKKTTKKTRSNVQKKK